MTNSLAFDIVEIAPLVGGVPERFDVVVTDGLERFGQTELAFGFRRGQVDLTATTRRLHGALLALGPRAQAGQPAAACGYTAFGPNSPSLIPDTDLRGLLYLPGEIPGLHWASSCLPAVIVPAGDALLAQHTSFLRVAARMGNHERYFPFPFWTDPTRPPVFRDGDESSLLARVPRLGLTGFHATRRPGGVRLVVSGTAARELADAVRAHGLAKSPAPLCLLSSIDPNWRRIMVWEPGQTEPAAITDDPDASDDGVGLHFVLMVPGEEASSARLIEEGMGLRVGSSDWGALVGALLAREGHLRLDDGTEIDVVGD